MPDYVDDWGGDLQDPQQRCRHGVFVGNAYGPDYMCGWCESGEEPEPEPVVPMCEHAEHYRDFDGSSATAECNHPARHTLVTDGDYGLTNTVFCSDHMSRVWDDHDQVGDTIWLDKEHTTRFVTAHIGKVILPPEDDEDPTCSSCNGAGEDRYEQTCTSCGGRGVER